MVEPLVVEPHILVEALKDPLEEVVSANQKRHCYLV